MDYYGGDGVVNMIYDYNSVLAWSALFLADLATDSAEAAWDSA